MEKRDPRIEVKLPMDRQTWNRFKAKCARNGTSMVQVLMKAIRAYMEGGKDK